MSLRVDPQNQRKSDDQNQVDSKKFPSDSARFEFESKLNRGGTSLNWRNWDGYKPHYDQFEKKVKIEETDDSIIAEVDDENVEPEKKGLMEDFVTWFKDGLEKIAKELGKALQLAQASVVVMSVQQAMSQAFQSVKLDSSQLSGKAQLPLETEKALADASVKGSKQLAETVKTLIAQNPEMAPAIAAAAMKEAAKASPATAADAAAQIVESAIQDNPQAAPQIAASVAQAAIENLPPEKAAEVLAGITKAAVEAVPSQAAAVAGEVAKIATQNLPPEVAAKVLGEITKAAVEAMPNQAAAIAGEVAKVASENLPPEVAAKVLGEITKAAAQANPQAASQIAAEVAEVAINELPSTALPSALGQIAVSAAEAAPKETAKIADTISELVIQNLPAEKLPEAMAQIVQGLSTVNPEAAPEISKAIVENVISSLPPELTAQIIPAIAQAASSASPDFVAEMVAGIMEALTDHLSSKELPNILTALTDLVAKTSPEDLAAVIATMISKISTLPQPLATELENVLRGIESASPDSSKPVPVPASQGGGVGDSNQTIDKAGESTAADFAANFQGAQVQTNFNASKIDAPLEQKTIPDNILKLIAETVSKIQIGETQTTITLQKTPDLPGDVTLEVRMENGRLEVNIKASDPQSAQLLQTNLAALQSALAAGAGASQVSVTVESPATPSDSDTGSERVGEDSGKTKASDSEGRKKVEGSRGNSGA